MNDNLTSKNIVKVKLFSSVTLSLLLAVAMVTQAPAQTILIDDFNDGDADGWTTFDWTVEQPWGPGTIEVGRTGAYHFESTGIVPDSGGGNPSVLGARWEPALLQRHFVT